MGVGGSSEIHVSFDRLSAFYFTGEQITGNISFRNTQEELTLDAIYLECIGELGYSTQEANQYRDKDGHERTEYFTKYHQIPFLNFCIHIAQPQSGQREIILYRGQHSWPFQFALPEHLPPSLLPSTTSYPYVKYYVRVVLDRPWYKPNSKQTFPLIIFPRVDLLQVPGGQHQTAFSSENRKKLRLQGYLVRGGVVPGETLSIHIDLQNPKRSEIKRIEVTFIQHRQVVRSCHSETIFRCDLSELRDFNDLELHRTFELTVPASRLSPTYTYATQSQNLPIRISVYYELFLDVKIRGLFTDFKMTVPVIVSTGAMSHGQTQQQEQQINNAIEMPLASAPILQSDEPPPPSYDEAVSNQRMWI